MGVYEGSDSEMEANQKHCCCCDNAPEADAAADAAVPCCCRHKERSPEEYKALVNRLSRIEGLTNDEIARRLRISKRTVEGHLNAALRTLRVKVGKFICWLTFFILLQ